MGGGSFGCVFSRVGLWPKCRCIGLGSRCVRCFALDAQELLQDPYRRLLLLRQLRMVEIDDEEVGYGVAVVVRRVLKGGVGERRCPGRRMSRA